VAQVRRENGASNVPASMAGSSDTWVNSFRGYPEVRNAPTVYTVLYYRRDPGGVCEFIQGSWYVPVVSELAPIVLLDTT
jgi:hypothetical protein